MERASRLIGRLTARTRPARMVRTRLIIEVEDPVWKKQLFALSGQILTNLERNLGQGIVEDLEFRVMQSQIPFCAILRRMYKVARKRALA